MDCTRRELLAAAGAGGLTATAGCGGLGGGGDVPTEQGPSTPEEGGDYKGLVTPTPTQDPTPNLTVDDFGLRDEDGELVVSVTVVNDGEDTGTGTFVVTVRAGDREFTREQAVELPTGESETYEFTFSEVTRSDVFQDGGLNVEWKSA